MAGGSDHDHGMIVVREDMVLQGRSRDWRTAWLGGLGPEDRREVSRAIRQGRRLSDPRLAPFVFGLGAQWRRWLWLLLVVLGLQGAMLGLWIYFNCAVHHDELFYAFDVVLGVLWLAAVVVALHYRHRRLRRVEEANRDLLDRPGP